MEDHRTNPDARAFREAVRNEDPARWGTIQDPSRRTDLHESHMHDRAMSADIDRTTGIDRTRNDDVAPTPDTTRLGDRNPTYAGPVTTAPIASRPPDAPTTLERERVVTDRPGTYATTSAEPPVEHRRFSIGATFLGWAVAAFFTIVFSAIALALTGAAAAGTDVVEAAGDLGWPSLVGYLVATFLAFLIGGYAAGRIALWDGVKHGLGTVAWSVVFALLGALAGTALADYFDVTQYVPFDFGNVTTQVVIGSILTLIVQLLGAALGGRMGERYHDRVHGIDTRHRRTMRGRPL